MNLIPSISLLFKVNKETLTKEMSMQSWYTGDALKSACDKGHNWITNRTNKVKSGYNKIQPKLLSKGLSTFKQEHCDTGDGSDDNDRFLKRRSRIHSVDIIDDELRLNFKQQLADENDSEFAENVSSMGLHGWS